MYLNEYCVHVWDTKLPTLQVVYFTALFPYAVLLILLGRGASLPGAIDGVKFYIIPKFDRLMDARVSLL